MPTPDTMTEIETENPFALDLRVVANINPIDALRDCQTDDGCEPSCASACVSPGGPL
jgi:FxLD family lantipeptide